MLFSVMYWICLINYLNDSCISLPNRWIDGVVIIPQRKSIRQGLAAFEDVILRDFSEELRVNRFPCLIFSTDKSPESQESCEKFEVYCTVDECILPATSFHKCLIEAQYFCQLME